MAWLADLKAAADQHEAAALAALPDLAALVDRAARSRHLEGQVRRAVSGRGFDYAPGQPSAEAALRPLVQRILDVDVRRGQDQVRAAHQAGWESLDEQERQGLAERERLEAQRQSKVAAN